MSKKLIDPSSLPYRPCVGICLFNKRGEVFVARRIDTDLEAWQLPQGGIDEGETPETALFRELGEEVGTQNAKIIGEHPGWLAYDLPVDLIGKVWKGRYRGQTQKWYALKFLGKDDEIQIETQHPEFSAWHWSPLGDIPDLIVPFKRDLYLEIVRTFTPIAQQLGEQK